MSGTDLLYYPINLLGEERLTWEIFGSIISGGQTAAGVMQTVRLDGGGLWKASLSGVGFWSDAHRKVWRALSVICDGGVQPIILPVRETIDAPWPTVGGSLLTSLPIVGHSDGSLFSDGSGYASSVIDITCVGAVALRATQMTIDVTVGGDLGGGEYFSIGHSTFSHRLYRIRTAVDNGDDTWDISFRPPLREAIPTGTRLEFDHPKCVMKLQTSDSMDAALEEVYFAKPSASFIEAFPPFPE